MQENRSNGNCIIVIPFSPVEVNRIFPSLKIDRLYFWYKNTFNHLVNDETLKFFLFYAHLYGATVYPDCPELGCIAINSPALLSKGEACVNQIHHNGELIYSSTNQSFLNLFSTTI